MGLEASNDELAISIGEIKTEVTKIKCRLDAFDLNGSLPSWKEFVKRLPRVVDVIDRVEREIDQEEKRRIAWSYLSERVRWKLSKKWGWVVLQGVLWTLGAMLIGAITGLIHIPFKVSFH